MSFMKFPTPKNYEEFLGELAKNDEVRNHYFYDMIAWGVKERMRQTIKTRNYMRKKRAKESQATTQETILEPIVAEPVVAIEPIKEPEPEPQEKPQEVKPPEEKKILLYQGNPNKREKITSLQKNLIFPTTHTQSVNVYNIIKK